MTNTRRSTVEELKDAYRELRLSGNDWPRLWWSKSESDELRTRAARITGFTERVRADAEATINDPTVFASEPAWHPRQQSAVYSLAVAAWYLREPRLVSLTTRLLDRAASAESWVVSAHTSMLHDHCASNVGATIAASLDLLAGTLTDDQINRYTTAIREKCLDTFLTACRERSAFWSRQGNASDWRIMTCGDAGTAALGVCTEEDADVGEILAYGSEGVVDVLKTATTSTQGARRVGMRYLAALDRYLPNETSRLHVAHFVNTPDFTIDFAKPESSVYDVDGNVIE